jgi:hypothetical protein
MLFLVSIEANKAQKEYGQWRWRLSRKVKRHKIFSNFITNIIQARSRVSSVGIATAFGLDDKWVRVQVPVVRNFKFFISYNKFLIQCLRGVRSPMGKERQEREAGHSPASITGVKNIWSYTSTPTCLHDAMLSEALREFFLKNAVFWDVTLCDSWKKPTFRRNVSPPSSGWQESVN